MGTNYWWRRALVLAGLGLGIFQFLAGLVGVIFWLLAGDWQPYTPIIVLAAFTASLPVAYLIWERYGPKD